jgi:3-phenylpropionate/trans-cinnamate dioxygenase ferredoxin reductase subunit
MLQSSDHVVVVGEEIHVPYDRPPLSKQVLVGKWDVAKATLATPELIAKNDVALRMGVAATGLDVATTTVHLADGSVLRGTHVVIATGARARRLDFSAGADLHYLRGRDDVVRRGFVGAEVATQLRARGLRPIVLEAAPRPLVGALGEEVSTWLEGLASGVGIELRSSVQVSDVTREGDGFLVRLADGDQLAARAVVVSVGAVVNVEWLATSGLDIDNGVVVDEQLMAAPHVAAIGDVARFMWRGVLGEELIRVEHWQVANDHAMMLAHEWVTGVVASAPLVPYFWSDQYAKKIQMLGHVRASDDVVRVVGGPDEGKWLALYSRDGVVNGIVALGQPRALMLTRHFLEAPTSLERALELAPWVG